MAEVFTVAPTRVGFNPSMKGVIVILRLDRGIQVNKETILTWMFGSSPNMTEEKDASAAKVENNPSIRGKTSGNTVPERV